MHTALFLFLALLPLGYAELVCHLPRGSQGISLAKKLEGARDKLEPFDPFEIAPTQRFYVGYSQLSISGAINGLAVHDISKYKVCNVYAEKNGSATDFDITVYNDEIAMDGGVQLDMRVFELPPWTPSADISVTLTNAGVQTSGTSTVVDGRKHLSNFHIRHFFEKFEVKLSCPGFCNTIVKLFRVNERLTKIGEKTLRRALMLDPLEAKLAEAIMNHDISEIKRLVKERLEALAKKFGDALSKHLPKGKGLDGLFDNITY